MSEPLTESELNKVLTLAKKELEDGLGFKVSEDLIILLKKMFLKDNWTKERLFYAVRSILRKFKYTEKYLKPSDFYENSEIKMFSYSEYLDNLNKYGKGFNDEIEWYKLNGTPFYVIKSDVEYQLPFERLN